MVFCHAPLHRLHVYGIGVTLKYEHGSKEAFKHAGDRCLNDEQCMKDQWKLQPGWLFNDRKVKNAPEKWFVKDKTLNGNRRKGMGFNDEEINCP